MMHGLGAVTGYRDSKKDFYKQYHTPYLNELENGKMIVLESEIADSVNA